MEVNKDEAVRCHDIALNKEARGDYAAALKFIKKSLALFPTSAAQDSLDRVTKLLSSNPNGAKKEQDSNTPNSGGTPLSSNFSSTAASRTPSQSSQAGSAAKKDGGSSSQRSFTQAQVDAVKKIKANASDFYAVLSITKTATENEIKKSYRKLALQFHPDKNSAPGADEAFKLVSKAFAILSDADKRAQYDRYGGDPEQRGGGGGSSGAAGFHSFQDEVSPEELFNMFFGGGFSQGGGFQSATFVGPDGRRYVRQFGGSNPRRYATGGGGQMNEGFTFNFLQLLPVLLLLAFSFLSSLFQESGPITPDYSFPKVTEINPNAFKTRNRGVPYIASKIQIRNYHNKVGDRRFARFESDVENYYIQWLSQNCRHEQETLERDQISAGGIFGWRRDEEKLQEIKQRKLHHCDTLRQFIR